MLGEVTSPAAVTLLVTRRVSEGELSCRFFLAHASGYHLQLFVPRRLERSQPRCVSESELSCRFFLAHASVYHLQLFSSKAFEKITASTRKRGIIRSTELSPSLWEGRRIRLRIGRGGFKNFDCSISERCLPSPDLRHDE